MNPNARIGVEEDARVPAARFEIGSPVGTLAENLNRHERHAQEAREFHGFCISDRVGEHRMRAPGAERRKPLKQRLLDDVVGVPEIIQTYGVLFAQPPN